MVTELIIWWQNLQRCKKWKVYLCYLSNVVLNFLMLYVIIQTPFGAYFCRPNLCLCLDLNRCLQLWEFMRWWWKCSLCTVQPSLISVYKNFPNLRRKYVSTRCKIKNLFCENIKLKISPNFFFSVQLGPVPPVLPSATTGTAGQRKNIILVHKKTFEQIFKTSKFSFL